MERVGDLNVLLKLNIPIYLFRWTHFFLNLKIKKMETRKGISVESFLIYYNAIYSNANMKYSLLDIWIIRGKPQHQPLNKLIIINNILLLLVIYVYFKKLRHLIFIMITQFQNNISYLNFMVSGCSKTIYLSMYTHVFVRLKYGSEIFKGFHTKKMDFLKNKIL